MAANSRAYGQSPQGGGGFDPLAAGKKRYGTGRPFPHRGKVRNIAGYNNRDARAEAQKEALRRRMRGN